jgi:hypothetical protein
MFLKILRALHLAQRILMVVTKIVTAVISGINEMSESRSSFSAA